MAIATFANMFLLSRAPSALFWLFPLWYTALPDLVSVADTSRLASPYRDK